MATFILPLDEENIFSGTLNADNIYGGNLSDVIYGGGVPGYIATGAGEFETIYGFGGNDTIITSTAGNSDPLNDASVTYAYGGIGRDTMIGVGGENFFFGDAGSDKLSHFAAPGSLISSGWLVGGGGADRLSYHGDVYDGRMFGGGGNDALWYVDTSDARGNNYVLMDGGAGADKFVLRFNLGNASSTKVEIDGFTPEIDRLFIAVIDDSGNVVENNKSLMTALDVNHDGYVNSYDGYDGATHRGVLGDTLYIGDNVAVHLPFGTDFIV